MKTLCYIAALAAMLAPGVALAQQAPPAGAGGSTNLWSSGQGTSDSYGDALGSANSASGSMANAGGRAPAIGLRHSALDGLNNSAPSNATNTKSSASNPALGGRVGGGWANTSALTTSNAAASTNGNGYSQVQTSGYTGGNVSGYGGRTR